MHYNTVFFTNYKFYIDIIASPFPLKKYKKSEL